MIDLTNAQIRLVLIISALLLPSPLTAQWRTGTDVDRFTDERTRYAVIDGTENGNRGAELLLVCPSGHPNLAIKATRSVFPVRPRPFSRVLIRVGESAPENWEVMTLSRDQAGQRISRSVYTEMRRTDRIRLRVIGGPDYVFSLAGFAAAADDLEPPRVCRRLQSLRGWSHEQT